MVHKKLRIREGRKIIGSRSIPERGKVGEVKVKEKEGRDVPLMWRNIAESSQTKSCEATGDRG